MATIRKRLTGAWIYILADDRQLPPERQSRFTLRPLTGGERDFYRDHMSRTVSTPMGGQEKVNNTSQMARDLCASHIESIENFPAGAPRPWPGDIDARGVFLESLEDAHVLELGVEIFTRSFVGPDEVKELGEVSPPTGTSSLVGS